MKSLKFSIGNVAFAIDLHHALITTCSAVVGALVAYFEQQSPESLITALQSWSTAKPLIAGAAIAVAGTLLALAKKSFLVPPAPPASPDAVRRGDTIPVSFAPPASKRVNFEGFPAIPFVSRRRAGWPLWLAGPIVTLAVAVVALTAPATTGCTPAQNAEWSQVESTVLKDIEAGKTLQQIADDVAVIVVGQSGPALVAIIDDVLQALMDLGAIPTINLAHAKDIKSQSAPIAAAFHASAKP